jgi:hypothetical protein
MRVPLTKGEMCRAPRHVTEALTAPVDTSLVAFEVNNK